MAFFGKGIATLNDLLTDELKNLYYMEQEIAESLPMMIETATMPELKEALSKQLQETENQIMRLDHVLKRCGATPEAGACAVIDALIADAYNAPADIENKRVLDAALIAAAQQIEHHEISFYGSVIAWANELGKSDCASVLAQTLEEEIAADRKLSELAERGVSHAAA